ncbi:hypothetical protein K8R33_03980 [archaeon]|nr:hypothetical protein [archaeon]
MKKLLFLLTLIFISSCTIQSQVCTEEAKMCSDGTFVARDSNNNCEFEPCQEPMVCDYTNNCPEGFNCYLFPDESEPTCYQGDPCLRCESLICDCTESFPMQIICN